MYPRKLEKVYGIDSKGNLYTSEVGSGKRVQKFKPAN
jgi:hypothetical protein